jgi:hypothetical protein
VSHDIRRTNVSVGTEGPDHVDEIRVYYDPTSDMPPSPSVSVVKELRVDPDKEAGLEGWRDRYDGQSSWARPWHEDQKTFKAYRGTLIHFAILSELGDAAGDTYYHTVGEDDWGREEYEAEYNLKKWSRKAPSANTDEVPYTPRDNQYDGAHAWDTAVRGIKWATRTFKQCIIDGTPPESVTVHADSAPLDGRLNPENVLAVEDFIYETEYGYGGQFDLLYEYHDGSDWQTVLADLKASSAVRFDNKLQLAAYKYAIEQRSDLPDTVDEPAEETSTTSLSQGVEIDECEVIRLHPDSETVEVSRSPQWKRTLTGLEHQFLGLVDEAHTTQYPEALERARQKLMSETTGGEDETTDEPYRTGTQAGVSDFVPS